MDFKRLTTLMSVVGALTLPFSAANAGVIDSSVTNISGNQWRYDYTINNRTPGLAFDEVTIYFAEGVYELLTGATAPAGWDALAIDPDSGIPADGFYDVLNLGGLLNDGETVSGFAVLFNYLGAGTPGVQSFDLIFSADFTVTYSGRTTQADTPGRIPEPATTALVLLALGALSPTRRTKERVVQDSSSGKS
jgi:hypothetical protein